KDMAKVGAGIAIRFDNADESLDQLLEENVVFPERVVRINQQCMSSHRTWRFAALMPRTASPSFFPSVLSLPAAWHLRRWPQRLTTGQGSLLPPAFSRVLRRHPDTTQSYRLAQSG